jgi:hypothetical protein
LENRHTQQVRERDLVGVMKERMEANSKGEQAKFAVHGFGTGH